MMENGAFAPKEQMLHFPSHFQIHDIFQSVNALLWSKGLSQHSIVHFHSLLKVKFY